MKFKLRLSMVVIYLLLSSVLLVFYTSLLIYSIAPSYTKNISQDYSLINALCFIFEISLCNDISLGLSSLVEKLLYYHLRILWNLNILRSNCQ